MKVSHIQNVKFIFKMNNKIIETNNRNLLYHSIIEFKTDI